MTTRQYTLEYVGSIEKLTQKLAKIPGATAKSAFKAAVAQERIQSRADAKRLASSRRMAAKSANAWQQAMGKVTLAITPSELLAAGRAVGDLAQHLADLNNEMADASTRTGLSVETLKALKLATEGSGQAFSELAPGLNALAKRFDEVARGTGEAKPAFEKLGLSAKDAQGYLKDMDGGLAALLAGLSKVPDAGERAALATQLFGRNGGKLLQSGLAGSTDALEVFIERANEFGLDTGPAAAKSAAEWQRAVADLRLAVTGLASALGGDISTAVSGLENFTLGLVAGFRFAEAGAENVGLALITLQKVIKDVASGRASVASLSARWATLGKQQAANYKQALESTKAFRDQREAIKDLATEAAGLADGEEAAAATAAELAKREREAAAAARAWARELDQLQGKLAGLADKNTLFFEGDSGRRDQQLRKVDELATELAERNALTLDADRTLANARLRIWSDYHDRADKEAQAARAGELAEVQRLHDAELALLQERAAEEQRIRDERRAAAQQLGTELLGFTTQLADMQIEARTEAAATIRARLEDENENLTANERNQLKARLKENERAAQQALKLRQALAVGQVLVDASAAAIRAYADLGPIAGAAFGVLLGAQVVGSLAAIDSATPPTLAHAGLSGPPSGSALQGDEYNFRLRKTERVLNTTGAAALGDQQIAALNGGRSGGGSGTQVLALQLGHRTFERQRLESDQRRGGGEDSWRISRVS